MNFSFFVRGNHTIFISDKRRMLAAVRARRSTLVLFSSDGSAHETCFRPHGRRSRMGGFYGLETTKRIATTKARHRIGIGVAEPHASGRFRMRARADERAKILPSDEPSRHTERDPRDSERADSCNGATAAFPLGLRAFQRASESSVLAGDFGGAQPMKLAGCDSGVGRHDASEGPKRYRKPDRRLRADLYFEPENPRDPAILWMAVTQSGRGVREG